MVPVIEGKIVEKWFEGQQKLLRVSLGKITVTGCVKEFQEKSTWVSTKFELARVRTIGMTRRFDFARLALTFNRPHNVSLLHMPFF